MERAETMARLLDVGYRMSLFPNPKGYHNEWDSVLSAAGADPTNLCSPDERYIRVSCGLDASFAAPIRGVYYGNSNESLEISVQTIDNSPQ